jgi:hypothetical protein
VPVIKLHHSGPSRQLIERGEIEMQKHTSPGKYAALKETIDGGAPHDKKALMIEEEEKQVSGVMGEDKTKGRIDDMTNNNPEQNLDEADPGFFGNINAGDYLHKLQEVGEIGVRKMESFIGHIKNTPHYLIDNEYIQRGYRINFNSHGKICESLFMLHNESVNVWSHLIGVIIFFCLLVWTIFYLNSMSNYLNFSYSLHGDESNHIISPREKTYLDFESFCRVKFNMSFNQQGFNEDD